MQPLGALRRLLCDAAAEENDCRDGYILASADRRNCLGHLLWLNDAMPEAPPALGGGKKPCSGRAIGLAWPPTVTYSTASAARDRSGLNAYQNQLPKNHRQAMNRAARTAGRRGQPAI